jgi:hypothetical protein
MPRIVDGASGRDAVATCRVWLFLADGRFLLALGLLWQCVGRLFRHRFAGHGPLAVAGRLTWLADPWQAGRLRFAFWRIDASRFACFRRPGRGNALRPADYCAR